MRKIAILTLFCSMASFGQNRVEPARPARNAPQPGGLYDITPATSRVVRRGDIEILTFETGQTLARLEELLEKSGQSAPQPGAMSTLYFRSRMDGSVQPYALWLPRDYTPGKPYPLLIQLHGLNFHKVLEGLRPNFKGMGIGQWIDVNQPVIVAQCFGRQSTFYQGMGEEDVLETIDDVEHRFAVDRERVYIMGHSMGGAGSYTVALHYPDRFGGVTPIDAAMGPHIAPPPADVPAWMQAQLAMVNPVKLFPNARNLDVFFKNAGAGIQRASTEYTDGIVEQGGFSTTESFPGMPHNFGAMYPYAMFMDQVTAHPIRENPPEVKFHTNTLRYNHAYWVTIDRLTHHNQDALVRATYDNGAPPPAKPGEPAAQPHASSVTVTTANIDALTLRLAGAAVPKGASMPLRIDGQEILAGPLPEVAYLSKAQGSWRMVERAPESGKRHGLQGPIGDAFLSNFLAVYGDGDRDLAIAELDAIRNPPGRLVVHCDFPMKDADKVTKEDIATSNLILFGTAASNPILKRIAHALPQRLMNGNAVFIHPNPENPERYVVVWNTRLLSAPENGLRAGYVMPLNLLPDYVEVRDGRITAGGHFDSDWR